MKNIGTVIHLLAIFNAYMELEVPLTPPPQSQFTFLQHCPYCELNIQAVTINPRDDCRLGLLCFFLKWGECLFSTRNRFMVFRPADVHSAPTRLSIRCTAIKVIRLAAHDYCTHTANQHRRQQKELWYNTSVGWTSKMLLVWIVSVWETQLVWLSLCGLNLSCCSRI